MVSRRRSAQSPMVRIDRSGLLSPAQVRRERSALLYRESRRRNRGKPVTGTDFISDLPDHLLHLILVCLKSAPAAARTSVLSHRWRRVWEDLPDLFFLYEDYYTDTRDLQCIDAALKVYSAPTVSSLDISVKGQYTDLVPDNSIDAWLRFASRRVTGTLTVAVYNPRRRCSTAEIDLPICERATSIDINILSYQTLLRFRSACRTFAALTELKITTPLMEAGEFEALLSLHCPRLTGLSVMTKLFVSDPDDISSSYPKNLDVILDVIISVRSNSLKRLSINLDNVRKLDIVTPMLQVINSMTKYDIVYISAPTLAEVNVNSPHLYQFTDAGRHLRRLNICEHSIKGMRRFDAVDELTLQLTPEPDQYYSKFLDDVNNLPKCEILRVSLRGYDHGLVPCMLQILRKADGIRKFAMDVCYVSKDRRCSLTCPCRLPEAWKADITLASLEEIEIDNFYVGGRLEFLELLLSRRSAPKLTSLRMTTRTSRMPSKEEVEKVRTICPPNVSLTITRKTFE